MLSKPMSQPLILATGLSKRYRIGEYLTPAHKSLKQEMQGIVSRVLGRGDLPCSPRYLWALKDVNFAVQEGEVLGIIGRNGAGKTTLLKLLAGMTAPTAGEVQVQGRVGTLLGLGVGLHPELTGRENISISGALYGLSRTEVQQRMPEIIAFSEIEEFMDTPTKFYSSGMRARLGFSIVCHLDHPDILLIDEALAAGDIGFKQKCLERIRALVVDGESKAVIVVSHSPHHIATLTDRCLYLEGGRVRDEGVTDEVLPLYVQETVRKNVVA